MSASRPRIAHVVLDLHEGGLERLVVDLALGTRDAGFDTRVFCLRRRGQLADELPDGDVVVVPAGHGARAMWWPRALAAAVTQWGADIIHAHSGVFLKAMRAGQLAGIPVVLTDHGRPHPDPIVARLMDGVAARGAACTIAVSDPLRRYLIRSLHVPAASVAVIRNGVRPFVMPSDTEVAALRARLAPPGRMVVGSVGRLDKVKAYDVLIRAMSQVIARSPGEIAPHLVLVGDGPDRARLERLVTDQSIGGHVTFAGWMSDVRAVLRTFDVFALTSHSEGTSVSLLEAMQAGRAVVATAVGGNPDVLGPELQRQLIPPRDEAALVHAIATMLESAALRSSLGVLAVDRAEAAFSQTKMFEGYARLYASCMESGAGAGTVTTRG